MKILLIGGTVFVGKHLAAELLERGHELTLFNRGKTRTGLFPGVREVHGDRDGGLDALGDEEFDWVVDTCGYVPRVVEASARYFEKRAKNYLFVSTISVYAPSSESGLDESAAISVIEDPETEVVDARTYGALKALCEQRVLDSFEGRALIPRPGYIVGPDDPTDRFTSWIWRLATRDVVLAPEDRNQPLQVIDVRDLARWMALQIEKGTSGAFNVAGEQGAHTMESTLNTCAAAIPDAGQLRWIPAETWNAFEGKQPMDFPLWAPDPSVWGAMEVTSAKAAACGLTYRPLAETVVDTLSWAKSRPADHAWRAGIAEDREAALQDELP
ncbi:MAG: NAD-dependent epimerase/dehydratase family protein [Planctomycetes bacterium]|nr:NAD-dependent epimerase/dehydratase family protein [Planctomycetota bacterium]